jgi:hypothetical protein
MNLPVNNHILIPDMPMTAYLKHHGLSSSAIAYLDQSPKHYDQYIKGKIRIEGKHLDLGTALHLALESQLSFETAYILRPEGMDKRSKAGKEAFAEFESSVGNKIILERDVFYRILGMVQSIKNTDDVVLQSLMASPRQSECSIFWTEQCIEQKCRPDSLIQPTEHCIELIMERWPNLLDVPFGISICNDFKTTSKGASPTKFAYACRDYGYYLKAAHYLAGTQADLFSWVAIESVAPYNCALYWFDPQKAPYYLNRRTELLMKLNQCNETNRWPGYELSPQSQLLG